MNNFSQCRKEEISEFHHSAKLRQEHDNIKQTRTHKKKNVHTIPVTIVYNTFEYPGRSQCYSLVI